MTSTTAKAPAAPVNVLAGLSNVFGTLVAGIEGSISAVSSSATSTILTNTVGGTIASDISDAQAAVADIKQALADAKAGKWSDEPHDVVDFVKHVFGILSRSGVNVPVVSAVVAALPNLPAVA